MTMKQRQTQYQVKVLNELYFDVLKWASVFTKEEEEEGNIWANCYEECCVELGEALEKINTVRVGEGRGEDLVELADALGDSFVVLSQAVNYYFPEYDPKKDEVLQKNMSDVCPEYRDFHAMAKEVIEARDGSEVLMLFHMLILLYNRVPWPMQFVVEDIMESNWSKFPRYNDLLKEYDSDSEKEVVAQACFEIFKKDFSSPVQASYNPDFGLYVFRKDDGQGKIMKWKGYQPPVLDYVAEYYNV